MEAKFCWILFFLSLLPDFCSSETYGVITASAGRSKHGKNPSFCIIYDEDFHRLPKDRSDAVAEEIGDVTEYDLCDDPGENATSVVEGRVAAVSMQHNCTYCDLAENVQKYGASATLILQNSSQVKHHWVNDSSDYSRVNITVAVMLRKDFLSIMKLGDDVKVQMYSAPASRWDYDLIVIWAMAVITVAIGAYWSGLTAQQVRERRGSKDAATRQEDDALEISPLAIVILVIMMCVMLLLLYFFYDYLVYVIIALFALASSISMYGCVLPLYEKLPCLGDCRIPPNKVPVLKRRPQIKCLALGAVCLAVGVAWAVLRNAAYAWILQNLLGIMFCVQMMKTIRLPSLKACTILLGLLFFYDIFFVFITPLFMPKGDSIMVHVATGGNSKSGEMLPMVLKVPRFSFSVYSVCSTLPYSLLGFGDVLVPGLLVSFCHGFDLKVGSRKVYYIASLIAYGLGMVVTFVALAFMETGQPALLYLVPATLLTTYALALARKQFNDMWHGKADEKKMDSRSAAGSKEEGPGSVNESSSPALPVTEHADSAHSISTRASDTSDEEVALLVNRS